jgi:hypothetical protein
VVAESKQSGNGRRKVVFTTATPPPSGQRPAE